MRGEERNIGMNYSARDGIALEKVLNLARQETDGSADCNSRRSIGDEG